jgi:hypothetical protein
MVTLPGAQLPLLQYSSSAKMQLLKTLRLFTFKLQLKSFQVLNYSLLKDAEYLSR